MTARLSISFLLPAMSETAALRATVASIERLAAEHCREILVILGPGATAGCVEAAESLAAEHPGVVTTFRQELPGLGGAVREGFARAAGSHVMLMAADLETDPEAIPRFVERMLEGSCDIVAGSRWLEGGGFEGYGRAKRAANRLFQALVGRLYGARLTDLTFAYRLYRREAIEGIVWEELGHPLLLECLLKPLRLGARVVEVPCRWRRRREGTSAGSWRQTLAYVPLAARLRLGRPERFRPGEP